MADEFNIVQKGCNITVKGEDGTQIVVTTQTTPITVTGGGAPTSFTALTDTPNNYTSSALKLVRVNSAGTDLEFVDSEIIEDVNWGEITGTLSDQTDLQDALDLKSDTSYVDSQLDLKSDITTFNTHKNNSTIHFTEASIDHANILNIGTNTHAQIDTALTRLADTSGNNTGDNATNTQYSGLEASKQDTLVSGTSIKTINSTSLLGSGNINTAPDLSDYTKKDGTVSFTSEPNVLGTFTAGESLVAGNVCYLKSDGKYYKTDADAEATVKGRILMALASMSANATGSFLVKGSYTTTGLTAGSTYFISATAGAYSSTAPSVAGKFVRVVGWANSTTSLYFDPSRDYGETA